ncbi:MAG: response regulator transcription factor [Spirochaetes bacterium]|nr:response regulator transcription factor [Spirochaetota bacterium]
MARIIIVEDNESIREAVASYLTLQDHEAVEFSKTNGVMEAIRMKAPDLIILDVMLPDGNGFQLAKRIKDHSDIPIIFLTAKTAESDRITGLEIGADDYVTKPFSPKELTLRVDAVLRRAGKTVSKDGGRKPGAGTYILGNKRLRIDDRSHRVFLDDNEISLTSAEWKILTFLVTQPGIVVTRDRILGECLDYMAEGSERTVDTHIKNIRKKLEDQHWFETVREYGYRFAGRPE